MFWRHLQKLIKLLLDGNIWNGHIHFQKNLSVFSLLYCFSFFNLIWGTYSLVFDETWCFLPKNMKLGKLFKYKIKFALLLFENINFYLAENLFVLFLKKGTENPVWGIWETPWDFGKKFILSFCNRTKKIHPWHKLLRPQEHVYSQQADI